LDRNAALLDESGARGNRTKPSVAVALEWARADLYFARKFLLDDVSDTEFALAGVLSLKTMIGMPCANHSAKAFLKVPGWFNVKFVELGESDGSEHVILDDGLVFSIV
jgi:hypothetical protein